MLFSAQYLKLNRYEHSWRTSTFLVRDTLLTNTVFLVKLVKGSSVLPLDFQDEVEKPRSHRDTESGMAPTIRWDIWLWSSGSHVLISTLHLRTTPVHLCHCSPLLVALASPSIIVHRRTATDFVSLTPAAVVQVQTYSFTAHTDSKTSQILLDRLLEQTKYSTYLHSTTCYLLLVIRSFPGQQEHFFYCCISNTHKLSTVLSQHLLHPAVNGRCHSDLL